MVTKGKRKRTIFDPKSSEPFKLSRSKIELFMRCQRCFYLDRKFGVGQPSGPPFALNSAVDHLLKKEFDRYRALGRPHPLMEKNNIQAIPYAHPSLDAWRENFVGVQYHDPATHFIVTGAVDDLWVDPHESLIVVDYKSTSKDAEITLDAEWQDSYKRQMEVYQWLLRKNGFHVSDTGYFVYCNAKKSAKDFSNKLEFDITVIPYTGDDSWIGQTLIDIRSCLESQQLPESAADCEFCRYRENAKKHE
jgi:hypothetical protein